MPKTLAEIQAESEASAGAFPVASGEEVYGPPPQPAEPAPELSVEPIPEPEPSERTKAEMEEGKKRVAERGSQEVQEEKPE